MTPLCSNGCGRKAFFRTKGNPSLRSHTAHDLCYRCWNKAVSGVRGSLPEPPQAPFHRFMPLKYYEAKVGQR